MSHIALLLPDLEVGGAERVMLLLARDFVARGHRVDLVLLYGKGPLLASVPGGVRVVNLGVRTHGLGQAGLTFSSVRRLATWLRREQPEALLSSITGANFVAVLARKVSGIPLRLVIRIAGSVRYVTSPLRRFAMRWLYPQADAVVALSVAMADDLIKIGVGVARIYCLANPVDVTFIQEQGRLSLDHPWVNDKQIRVVVSVGRLTVEKDYACLVRAMALLPLEHPARLIIVGEGAGRATLEQLIVDCQLENRVFLVGLDVNPWRWMAKADLFVLSSRSEGCPNALIEAIVLGIPVVATEYDVSIHDFFSEIPDYPRRIVAVGDTKMMADAIVEMIGVLPKVGACFEQAKWQKSVSEYEKLLLSHVERLN